MPCNTLHRFIATVLKLRMFATVIQLKSVRDTLRPATCMACSLGKTIVSASPDGTIKVWELRPYDESEWEQFEKTIQDSGCDSGSGSKPQERIETWWRNGVTGSEQATKPTAGALDTLELIKVWKTGGILGSKSPLSARN